MSSVTVAILSDQLFTVVVMLDPANAIAGMKVNMIASDKRIVKIFLLFIFYSSYNKIVVVRYLIAS